MLIMSKNEMELVILDVSKRKVGLLVRDGKSINLA